MRRKRDIETIEYFIYIYGKKKSEEKREKEGRKGKKTREVNLSPLTCGCTESPSRKIKLLCVFFENVHDSEKKIADNSPQCENGQRLTNCHPT